MTTASLARYRVAVDRVLEYRIVNVNAEFCNVRTTKLTAFLRCRGDHVDGRRSWSFAAAISTKQKIRLVILDLPS